MVVCNLKRMLARVGPKHGVAAQSGELLVLEGGANAPVLRRVSDACITGVRPVPSLSAKLVDDANVEPGGKVVHIHELARVTAGKRKRLL